MTKLEIKEYAKNSVDEEFCILYLTRNLLKSYENKTNKEILEEFKKLK